jgi:hypothetical protein
VARFAADYRADQLVDLASCDRRTDFPPLMRARFRYLAAQSRGIQGLAAQPGARHEGSTSFNHAFRRWTGPRRLWRARAAALRTSTDRSPGGVPNLARESKRLAGVKQAAARAISYVRQQLRLGPGTFETGNRRPGAAGDREIARRTPITPDREG